MFYCDPCGKKKGWPLGGALHARSRGPCEVCGEVEMCNSVPSKDLPLPKEALTIFKYPLAIVDQQKRTIPGLKRILSVAEQRRQLVLYALVGKSDTVNRPVDVDILIIGTGHPIATVTGFDFLGTVKMFGGELMWHIFVKPYWTKV